MLVVLSGLKHRTARRRLKQEQGCALQVLKVFHMSLLKKQKVFVSLDEEKRIF